MTLSRLTATTRRTTPGDVDANTKYTITVDERIVRTILFRNEDGDIVRAGDILSIDNASTAAESRFSLQEKHHLLRLPQRETI